MTSVQQLAATLLLGTMACAHSTTTAPGNPTPLAAPKPAPDSFTVQMITSRGPVTMMIRRFWAPHGVDRFYQLVTTRYYDSARFFRVVPNFVVQWGLGADPANTAKYRDAKITDDPVRYSNLRGTISFARSGKDTRTTQLFINLVDNGRLDIDSGFGFPPIGRVISGMPAIDSLTAEYNNKMPRAVQDSITQQGNAYLTRAFPKLDYILSMKITKRWK